MSRMVGENMEQPSDPKSQKACLLIHGFTGGPHEVEPLAQVLKTQGYYCVTPVLKGHEARDGSQLKGANFMEWLSTSEKVAKRLSHQFESLDLVGFSMGGMIAAYLAARITIRKLVLLNPALIYLSPVRFGKQLISSLQQKDWSRLHKINTTPVVAVIEFMKLVRYTKKSLDQVLTPTFIAQGALDPIVHPMGSKRIYRKMKGEKKLVYYPHSGHFICHDADKAQLFRDVQDFLK